MSPGRGGSKIAKGGMGFFCGLGRSHFRFFGTQQAQDGYDREKEKRMRIKIKSIKNKSLMPWEILTIKCMQQSFFLLSSNDTRVFHAMTS